MSYGQTTIEARTAEAERLAERVEIIRTPSGNWVLWRNGRMLRLFGSLLAAQDWANDAFECLEWGRARPGRYIAIDGVPDPRLIGARGIER